jgi:hypothetical protein
MYELGFHFSTQRNIDGVDTARESEGFVVVSSAADETCHDEQVRRKAEARPIDIRPQSLTLANHATLMYTSSANANKKTGSDVWTMSSAVTSKAYASPT